MNTRRTLVLCSLLALLLSVGALADATRARVVLIGDTQNSHLKGGDDLNAACETNIKYIKSVLEQAFSQEPRRYQVESLTGNDALADGVRNFFQSMSLEAGESLMVYYCGHGAHVDQHGHLLIPGRGNPMLRNELQSLMLAHRPQGALLLTDACSEVMKLEDVPAEPSPSFMIARILLLKNTGFINLSGTRVGEKAYFDESGGYFTNAFLATFAKGRAVDFNNDNTVSLDEILKDIGDELFRRVGDRQHLQLYSRKPLNNVAEAPPRQAEPIPQVVAKYIAVSNQRADDVYVTLSYRAYTPEGQSYLTEAVTWTIPAGGNDRLLLNERVPLVADYIEYSVSDLNGQALTAAKGNIVATADRSDTYTIPIR